MLETNCLDSYLGDLMVVTMIVARVHTHGYWVSWKNCLNSHLGDLKVVTMIVKRVEIHL